MAAYLRVGDNLRLAMKHIGTLLMLVLLMFVAGLVIGLVAWVPCIGWLLAMALSTPVIAHLAGQAGAQIYRESLLTL
jgi:Mg/Co/Ni transporter MgtE